MDRKSEKTARVGVFGIGLEAYWAQFDGLRERLEGYTRSIEERLGEWASVVLQVSLTRRKKLVPRARSSLKRGWL